MSETPMMCPHCGWRFYHCDSGNGLVPYHVELGEDLDVCMENCPGSQQTPRNALSDRRPLWKDLPYE